MEAFLIKNTSKNKGLSQSQYLNPPFQAFLHLKKRIVNFMATLLVELLLYLRNSSKQFSIHAFHVSSSVKDKQAKIISSTSKWSDLTFQKKVGPRDDEQLIPRSNDTNELLTKQYQGTDAKIKDPVVDGLFVKKSDLILAKHKQQNIAPKIGTNDKKVIDKTPLKNLRKKGDSVPISSYCARIKKTVQECKRGPAPMEFMDYSKYHRFKKHEPKLSEEAQEFQVSLRNKNLDEVDLRRVLINSRIPFSFKTENKNEIQGKLMEGKLSILVKGEKGQVSELKDMAREHGVDLTSAKSQFNSNRRFTGQRIETEMFASRFIDDRKGLGKVASSLLEKRKELGIN